MMRRAAAPDSYARRVRRGVRLTRVLCLAAMLWHQPARPADAPSEYRLKAAFLFNFAQFIEWPVDVGGTLNLCVYGHDPFGNEIDALAGKAAGRRVIALQRRAQGATLTDCQIVFVASSAIGSLDHVIDTLHGAPVLTVADSPGAARLGAVLNMIVVQDRVRFEANNQAARSARLRINPKLLRLATEVFE